MNPVYNFSGHVALVTGACSGMGLATARQFAKAGASVGLVDVNQTRVAALEKEFKEAGYPAIGIPCDVSNEQQVADAVERTVATFGRLDMAFNNAGIIDPPSETADEPAEN